MTIFPAESSNNTQKISAMSYLKQQNSTDSDIIQMDNKNNHQYEAWFRDLQGGRTEYVITIACMVGRSRMKGEKIVTHLVPYGPEKPRAGMVKSVSPKQVEVFWDPPKGEFSKYIMTIIKLNAAPATGIPTSEGSSTAGSRRSSLVGTLDLRALQVRKSHICSQGWER